MGSIRVVRGSAIPAGPAAHGAARKMTEVDDLVTAGGMRMAATGDTGWHHHGEHTTYVYVLQGQVRIEWGAGGRESVDLASGDVWVMSPGTVHRETNPGSEDLELVVFSVGSGPQVVGVDGPEQ